MQQLNSLIESLPNAAVLVTGSGDILHANEEACLILGRAIRDLRLFPVNQVFKTRDASSIESLLSQPGELTTNAAEAFFVTLQSGRELPVTIGLHSCHHEEKDYTVLTFVDKSPVERANEMFHQSVRVAPHGVLVINKTGEIKLVNRYICDCFGYSEDELLGQSVEMLLPSRHRHRHAALRDEYYKAPTVRTMGPGRDLTALHKDGSEFPVEVGLSTFDDIEHKKMVMVSLVDITERKKMELEMREINTNLEEFTYVVSHDLRSPLRGISDLVQWIEEDLGPDTPEKVSHNLNRVNIRVERMERLIENLLVYARAGSASSDLVRIDVESLIYDVCDFVQIPDAFSLELSIEPGFIVGARTPLETVLRNLVSNALKHHDRTEGSLVISSAMEQNFCHFSVCDDGPGIPGNMHDRIFRLFQTVTASERQGTGIGLSVSRRLVETHGGRVSVNANEPSRGSTFHVWWPRFIRKDTYD